MSLNQIMSAATSGLMASQTQMRVTSDNIANVNTVGYIRKQASQVPLISAGLGVGVDISQIKLAANVYLQKASLNANASAAQANAMSSFLDRAQTLFGDPSESSSFFARLDSIYASFSSAATNASSSVSRQAAIGQVSDFLSETSRISASLKSMGQEADSRIAGGVERVNALLSQIDSLNNDISRARVATGDSTGPENVQSQLIDELGTLIDININPKAGGGVVVRASDGLPLAGEGGAAKLAYNRQDGASGEISVTLANGSGVQSLSARLTSGEIKGLLDLRDRELPAMSEQLAELVSQTVDQLNRAHNAAAAVPPPTTLTGKNTGLDLPTALNGFTGKTTLAVTGADGMLQKKISIDFSAGTMSVDGGAAIGFSPTSFLSTLNGALGSSGSASFNNGALSLSATGTSGVAIADDAANPSSKAGKGFSHFFGLNDLVSAEGITDYNTGLKATDPHGFTAGGALTLRIADPTGARIRDISIAVPPGGTMQDLLNSLNAPTTGVGNYGQFSLDAKGAMTFTPSSSSGVSMTVLNDQTERGAGGPSMTELFGVGSAQRSSRATKFDIRADIAANPQKMALATLDLSQAASGKPVLSAGDGRGALLLADSGKGTTSFAAAGGLSAVSMTVSRYANEIAGSIARKADSAGTKAETASAVATEATARRSSVEGVNLDEELVNLTTFQQAYNASARLVTAAKDMYDILLTMVGT